jgi:hypothetical protein
MSRRFPSRERRQVGGHSTPSAAHVLVGVGGFSATSYYQTANPGGEAGTNTGFGVAVLFRVPTQAVSSGARILTERQNGSVAGWTYYTAGTQTQLRCEFCDAGGITRLGPVYTITAGDVGKVMMGIAVFDGTHIRHYVNRAEVATAVAITGYTASSSRQYLGSRAGSLSTTCEVYSVSTFRGVATLGQVQAAFDLTKALKEARSPLGETFRWSAKHGTPPSSLLPLAGADTMSIQGSGLAAVYGISPVWGW